MSLDVTITLDSPDPEECASDVTELYDNMRSRLSGSIEGTFIPYVTGAATPGVDDQDKVWHRVDADGRPLGTFIFYSGTWRKEYNCPIGMWAMYSGDPGVDFAGTGGAGTIGGQWDGWQLLNGENGVPNLSDKFIVGAKMDDLAIGYPEGNGPWKTNVSGETTQEGAGVHEITLTEDTTYRTPRDAVKVSRWEADGNTLNPAGDLYGRGTSMDLLAADAGNLEPDPIPTLPNYYASAIAVFKGYA